jgi:hypothetical protein
MPIASPLNQNMRYHPNLRMNSPITADNKVIYYVSPLNVNGNNNIVNANLQIY